MDDLMRFLNRLLDSISGAIRILAVFVVGFLAFGLFLWFAIALLNLQTKTNLIASGLLLIGLLVILVSGVIGGIRSPGTMLWSGVALLLMSLALSLPWGAWWAEIGAGRASERPVLGDSASASVPPAAIFVALTDRGRSATGLSAFDVWLVMMVLMNLALVAQLVQGRRSALYLVRANGLAVFLLLGVGLVLSHWVA